MADSATYTPETLQRRYAMAQALLADPKTPIVSWAQGLNELAKGALGGYQLGNTERLEAKQRGDANAQVMAALGLGGQAQPAALPMQPAPSGGASTDIPGRIVGAESGGVPTATNPNSTAAGPGQFIDSTWLETLKKNRPDLAAGKDDAALLAMRTDPAQAGLSRDMTDAYAKQNSGTLAAAGLPVTPGTTYLAHFAGPAGATKILSANPAAPVSSLLSSAAIQANPQIANMSAGELRAWADKKMGGSAQSPAVIGNTGVAATPDANGVFGPDANVTPPPSAIGAIASALNGAPSGAPTAGAGASPSPAVADVAKTLSAPAGAPAAPLAGPAGVGANPNAKAIAAVLTSPWIDPSVKQAVIAQSSPSFGFQTLPDGTIVRTNPKTGQVEPIYQTPSKPQFVPNVGANPYGVAQPGFVDPLHKQAFDISGKPINANPQAAQNANPDVTGEDFLKTMPKAQADQIKGITEGRISPPGAFALKTPYWQKMLTDVAQYEPGFDLTKWGARSATAKDFASGKSAQNITSFNTAISHLDTLDKAADGLNNSRFPMVNSVKNMIASGTGDPAIKQFDVAKNAVTDELTRAFRGSGGSVHDVKQWEDAINAANSPAQLKAAVKQATELLRGRIESLGETYNRGMNTKTEAIQLLSPKAQKVLGRLSGEAQPEASPAAVAPAAASADIDPAALAEARRRGLVP